MSIYKQSSNASAERSGVPGSEQRERPPVTAAKRDSNEIPAHVDWITLFEPYHADYRDIPAQAFSMHYDENGEFEKQKRKQTPAKGSADSTCYIRFETDEESNRPGLTISFNPSRWNRKDNLLGVDVTRAIEIAEEILAEKGWRRLARKETFTDQYGLDHVHEGTIISKLDITRNYVTGSVENADEVMRQILGRTLPRMRQKTEGYPGEETIYFGGKKKLHRTVKIYRKYLEVLANNTQKEFTREEKDYRAQTVARPMQSRGVVRVEMTYGSAAIKRAGMRQIENVCQDRLNRMFEKDSEKIMQPVKKIDVTELNNTQLGILTRWQLGQTQKETSAWYRARTAILEKVGVDIGKPCPPQFRFEQDGNKLMHGTVTIKPRPLEMKDIPDGYEMPDGTKAKDKKHLRIVK